MRPFPLWSNFKNSQDSVSKWITYDGYALELEYTIVIYDPEASPTTESYREELVESFFGGIVNDLSEERLIKSPLSTEQ